MINNDSERIFQDSNFLADSDFTYLFDFSERDGEQSEMNVFFGGNVTETFAPVINAGTSFCEPSTDHDMFDGWQKSDDCLAMQTTFDISSSTTSASHSTATQLNACQPGQYSKPLFQHVQAASGTTENKRRKIDDDSLHREASDSFANLRHSPHKYHTVKHSRKILGETESEERGTPGKQSSSDLGKMLSTYPAAGSGSAGRRLPSPVSTSIHGSMQQLESISVYALKCLTKYGFCALDNFMGQEAGSRALSEVMKIESQGLFEDGRLVTQERNSQSVRGDKIFWIDSDTYPAISRLISRMDLIVFKLQKSFPERSISSRTKPMVACYPGLGAAYRRHVDNSNQDGRLITCLYYLNKDWDLLRDGGLLRLYPSSVMNKVEIEPIFDRILFFWSDNRNPHEVLPAFRNRYAITVWYFDQKERERAMKRLQSRERK